MCAEFRFELKEKDLAGRIGLLEVNGRVLETPALMPVYNPGRPLVSVEELKEKFNVGALMANAYMMLSNPEARERVLSEGVHGFLGFDGIIATDSGSFQLMAYGKVSVTNNEIIGFEERIGADIGSFLDIPSLPDAYKPRAEEELALTLERAKEAKGAKFVVNAGVQGSTYLDLRKKAASAIGRDFDLCAVGGIVRLMEDYRFADLVDVIVTVKRNIPPSRAVHAFGLGHPMVFSLAAALGCDLFDSAAYALYAQDDRYMTDSGTKKLEVLDYLPCSCPVCSRHGIGLKELPEEERRKALALHNLYVSYAELGKVKQAIHEGSLWELVSLRGRSHPAMYSALMRLKKYGRWLSESDPVTKKTPFYYAGSESACRPEVYNAKARMKRVSSKEKVLVQPFGSVPAEILDLYPFGSFDPPLGVRKDTPSSIVSDLDKIRAIMEYQFGRGAGELIDSNFRIKKSRATKRIRWIYKGKDMVAAVRASDHLIIPKGYVAEGLLKMFPHPRNRVVIEDDAVPFVEEGKSAFCRFVSSVDPELRAGDEVLVVDKEDKLIRVGTLVVSPKEAVAFRRGVAVVVR